MADILFRPQCDDDEDDDEDDERDKWSPACVTWTEWHFGFNALFIFLDPNMVWFPSHLYIGVIPNPSGQLAELIVYIIPLE